MRASFLHFGLIAIVVLASPLLACAQRPELVVQTGHASDIRSLALSPDGHLIASGGSDNTVRLWDLTTGNEIRVLRGHSSAVFSVTFSLDSKTLVSVSKKQVNFWHISSGDLESTYERTTSFCDFSVVAFSADGTIAAFDDCSGIELYDLVKRQPLRRLTRSSTSITSLAISPDGKWLASGENGINSITIWDLSRSAVVATLGDAKRYLDFRSIAFTPDSKALAGSSQDLTISLWSMGDWKILRSLNRELCGASDPLFFSPEGKTLFTAACRGAASWNVETGQPLRIFASGAEVTSTLAYNGKTLALGTYQGTSLDSEKQAGITIWNLEGGAEPRVFANRVSYVNSVAFSPDTKVLAAASYSTSTKQWDLRTGDFQSQSKGPGLYNLIVAFDREGKLLLSGNTDQVNIQEHSSGREVLKYKRPISGTPCLAFNPNGSNFAACNDSTVNIWGVRENREIHTLPIEKRNVNPYLKDKSVDLAACITFRPDGEGLAIGTHFGFIEIWDVVQGKRMLTSERANGTVTAVSFDHRGKVLASGISGGEVRLWSGETGAAPVVLGRHNGDINSLAFAEGDELMASGSDDRTIKLWSTSTGKEVRTLKGHANIVNSVAFSPDGKLLVSSSNDATIKLWDVATGTELASLVAIAENDWLVVTPDGLFDGTPAGWDKVLWRYNNDTFQVTPVEAYFADFYYPGLLTDIFAGQRPKASIAITNIDRRQIPVVLTSKNKEGAHTSLGSRTITLQVDVQEAPEINPTGSVQFVNWWPASGARDVRLLRNGSLVRLWQGDLFAPTEKDACVLQSSNTPLAPRRSVCTATVPIVAGPNNFTAYAFNHDNIKSSDATLRVTGADTLKRSGTAYILAVGVNNYSDSRYNLKYAVADAREFSAEVKRHQELLKQYEHIEVIPLYDKDATKQGIRTALTLFADGGADRLTPDAPQSLKLIKKAEPEDTVIVFFAGHGTAKGERFYLLPHDFVAGNEEQLKASAVSDVELNDLLEHVGAGKLLLVIDACQSGQALGEEKEGRGPMNSKGLAQLAYDKGMYILTAAQSYQAAKEVSRTQSGKDIQHGLLTFALLEGLSKGKKDTEGRISEREWMNYAVDQVPLMQIDEMKKRSDALEQQGQPQSPWAPVPVGTPGQRGAQLVFVDGDNSKLDPEKRNVQRPRVFYRRELEAQPLIVAKP